MWPSTILGIEESFSLPKAILANLLGDLWSWIADVAGHIADVSVYWLIVALALKTAESALIGLA